MLTPEEQAAFERALPEIDPEMGEFYFAEGTAGCMRLRKLRGENVMAYPPFEHGYNPYAVLYADGT